MNANKDFILDWFKTTQNDGVFEEQSPEDGLCDILYESSLNKLSIVTEHDTVSQSQPICLMAFGCNAMKSLFTLML